MKRWNFLNIAVFSLIFLCGCGRQTSTASLLAQAKTTAAEGKWSDALEYTKKAVSQDPKNIRALVLNALACENCGKANEALEEIAKAASLAPDQYFVQYTHGRLLFEHGRYDSCISPLKHALKLRPDSKDALVLLARVSVIQKNIREARYYYSLMAKNPVFAKTPAPWNELGLLILMDGKNPKEAFQYLAYSYRLAPSDPTTVLNLAVLYDSYFHHKTYAKSFYQKYLTLTQRDSSLDKERILVSTRMKAL